MNTDNSKNPILSKNVSSSNGLEPLLRFRSFSDCWHKNLLGNLGSFMGGGTPSKSEEKYWNGSIPWISSSDMTEDSVTRINISRYINYNAIDNSATKLCPENTIHIVSRVGVGKVAISHMPLCTSQDFTNFISNDLNDRLFLTYYLSVIMKKKSQQTQGTSIKGITSEEIKKLRVYLPSLLEQEKIANFLSLVDERIEQQRQLVEALKRYKRGYFQQIILGLDTTEFEVADVVKEYTEKTQTQNEYPILSSTLSGIQLQNSYFNKQAASENTVGYKIVPYGYFTYRSMSDTGDFRFNLQTIIDKGIVSPAYPVFSILDDHESEFVEYILNETDKIKNQLRIIKEGGTRYALSFAKFKTLTISLPTKQQQKNFVNQLRLFNKLLNREETIYIDLQKHKSALLQQMFI